MPFGASKSTIEFYDCINTTASVVKREHFASFLLFSSVPLSLLLPFFFLFRLPRARKRRCREQRGTKKKAVSRCKIYDVQVSANERGASRSFPSPNRWKIDGDVDDDSVPCIYFVVCSFVPSFGNGEGRSRARAELIFKVPDGGNDRGLGNGIIDCSQSLARFEEVERPMS